MLVRRGRPLHVDMEALTKEVAKAARAADRGRDTERMAAIKRLRPSMLEYPPPG